MQKDVVIYKQAAIDALREEFKRVPTNAIRATQAVENLPPAQPELQWIPVSEKLPEPMQKVLITFEEYDQLWVTSARFIYYRKTLQWDWDSGSCGEVKAWMPLPEPYKEVTT